MNRMASIAATSSILVIGFIALADAQLQLPKAMKGNSNYQGRVNSPWSLVIDKMHSDGAFEGTVTYEGRQCSALRNPTKNGVVTGDEIRFNVWMGPQCSENTFVLQRGKSHFLEGELRSNVAPDKAQVWLDPDS